MGLTSRVHAATLVAILLLSPFAACGADRRPEPAGSPVEPAARDRPRLVVVLVVDQMRADYLERFRAQFSGGFKRMLEGGLDFANANYEQWPTVTAVGHATIVTGATPAGHGIVGNGWYDAASGARVTAVADATAALVTRPSESSASPRRLIGTTIGDELKLATAGRGRTVSVALKDRSAVLMGGKSPTGAYWYDTATGGFVTSTYYSQSLPPWLVRFNAARPADAYFGSSWNLLLRDADYAASDPDDAPGEQADFGAPVFPHAPGEGLPSPNPTFYARLESTPFANELVFAAARAAVEGEDLGADDVPDLLCIGLSANDAVGHGYGPYSREVQDMTLRTDLEVGEFLTYLDARVGKGRYTIVLTADHGVAPTPAHSASLGGRYVDFDTVAAPLAADLAARFGPGAWVADVSKGAGNGIYLNRALAASKNVPVEALEGEAARFLLTLPYIREAIPASDLARGAVDRSDLAARRMAAAYCPGRSPDVAVAYEPYAVPSPGPGGTSHGTPYNYDSHVPVVFYGAGVPAGVRTSPVAVTDVAATLATILGITPPPACVGQSLIGN